MSRFSLRRALLVAVLPSLAVLSACDPTTVDDNLDTVCNGNVCSSIKQFSNILEQQLTGAVGYAYVVSGPGLPISGAKGFARTSADTPSREFDPDTRINVASVSKTITAVAVLKALAAQGKDVDTEKIGAYLPSDWTRGPGVNDVTFAELLTHTSGLRAGGNDVGYEHLKSMVADGVTGPKTREYVNANFALFRVILPYLNGFTDPNPAQRDALTSAAYVKYVQEVIWQPLGRTADCKPPSVPTLVYPLDPGTAKGVNPGDSTLTSGGEGWTVSAADLWNFLRALHYSETLLTAAQRTQMYTDGLGWDPASVSDGAFQYHNGYLGWSVDNKVASINTAIAILPSGLIVSMVANSPADLWAINTAYEGSKVTK